MTFLLNRYVERDLARSHKLAGDLAIERGLLGLDCQGDVGPLLVDEVIFIGVVPQRKMLGSYEGRRPGSACLPDGHKEADQVDISAEINGRGCGLWHREGARPASKPGIGGAAKGVLDRLSGGLGLDSPGSMPWTLLPCRRTGSQNFHRPTHPPSQT